MRIIGLLCAIASLAACSKHNPLSCCTSDTQCSMFGLDQVTPCSSSSEVCNADGVCVAPECSTSADCTSPDAPVCVGQLCVAACTGDMDCTGAPTGPYCASDGACVACTGDTQCADASAPVCDTTTNSCRGCKEDSECTNGVCLEADGTCAPEAQVVYVAEGGNDSGACTATAACASLAYAMGEISSSRSVMHVEGTVSLGISTLSITKPMYLDGANATLEGFPSSGPAITIPAFVTPVTLARVMLTTSSGQALTVLSGSSLRVFQLTTAGSITVTNGTLDVERSNFSGSSGFDVLTCSSGTVTIDSSRFTGPDVNSSNCQFTVRASSFVSGAKTIKAMGGVVSIENSLFVETVALADSVFVQGTAPGSTVQFDTFANVAAVSSDGAALTCDSAVMVSSNIFAYGSMHPQVGACTSQYSLYDTVALAQFTTGTGDKVGDSSTFFMDLQNMDFHLAADSPALMSAEMGLPVTDDYEGNPRPNPAGSTPDVGAYEAP